MATTSAMPSPAICDRWNSDETPGTLGDVMLWCRISGPLQVSLLQALDAAATEPYRVLTMMAEDAAKDIVGQVKVNEAAPNS